MGAYRRIWDALDNNEPDQNREGLNTMKLWHAITLPFSPEHTRAFMEIDRFEDLDIEKILKKYIRALILDVDATLVTANGRDKDFKEGVVNKLKEAKQKMPDGVLIASNNAKVKRDIFDQLGIPVLTHTIPKPHPGGLIVGAQLHLKNTQPGVIAVIDDNPLTGGGAAKRAGMEWIKITPIPGTEGIGQKSTRSGSLLVAKLHDKLLRRGKSLS